MSTEDQEKFAKSPALTLLESINTVLVHHMAEQEFVDTRYGSRIRIADIQKVLGFHTSNGGWGKVSDSKGDVSEISKHTIQHTPLLKKMFGNFLPRETMKEPWRSQL